MIFDIIIFDISQILPIIKLDKDWEMTISNVEVISDSEENTIGMGWSTLAEIGLRENGRREIRVNKYRA